VTAPATALPLASHLTMAEATLLTMAARVQDAALVEIVRRKR
jgi:hypothetical protein